MGIQGIIDSVIKPHGNWEGLSPGWVILIWSMSVLSERNHLLESTQQWVCGHLVTLRGLSKQDVTELDFTTIGWPCGCMIYTLAVRGTPLKKSWASD